MKCSGVQFFVGTSGAAGEGQDFIAPSLSRPHMKASSFSCRLDHQLVYAAAYKCIASQPPYRVTSPNFAYAWVFVT